MPKAVRHRWSDRPRRPWLLLATAAFLLVLAFSVARGGAAATTQISALPPLLAELAEQAQRLQASGNPTDSDTLGGGSKALRDALNMRSLRLGRDGRVQVDVQLVGAGPAAAVLESLGVETQIWRPDIQRAQLRAPAHQLPALLGLPGVVRLDLPSYALTARGSLTSEGDVALRAEELRQSTGLTGAGVRIGVISDGIAGLAAAQASGDLPALAEQIAFDRDGLTEGAEGTAMLEIIHDLAPEAALYFASASTDLEMIEAVNYLAERTDVVVDDLGFFFPDDQQSSISVNTAQALNNPDWPIRAYVTSVGNWSLRHYEGEFRAGPDGRSLGLAVPGPVHLFGGPDGATDELGRGESSSNELLLGEGDELRAVLFWNDPWDDATNDYDLLLLDENGNTVAAGTSAQGVTSSRPRERIAFKNEGSSAIFRLVVQNVGGQAESRRLELFAIGASALQPGGTAVNFNTLASSMLAQSDAGGGVISTAAVGHDPASLNTVRQYSSRGPTNNGASKPDLTGVDGVVVTGSGGFSAPFFGTSAAAPHVAAVAALLLEARTQLLADDGGTPERERALLRGSLTDSAVDLGAVGPDLESGAGRVDAVAALQQLEDSVFVVDSAADEGEGSLRAAIEAANASAAAAPAIFVSSGLQIELLTPLPAISVDGLSLTGGESELSADALPAGAAAIVISGDGVSVADLTVTGAPGAGVHIDGASNVTVDGVTVDGNGAGVLVDGGATTVSLGTGSGLLITRNEGHGVVVSGAGTRDVLLQNSNIGIDASGAAAGNGADGIRVESGATGVVIGADALAQPALAVAQAPDLAHTIRGRVIRNGRPAPTGTLVEALLDGDVAVATTVGLIDVDGQPGFLLTVPGPGIVIRFRVAGETAGNVVFFEEGALTDVVIDVTSEPPASETSLPGANTIAFNSGLGVSGTSGAVTVRGNATHSNAGGDLLTGTSAPDPPLLTDFHFTGDRLQVSGRAEIAATVDLYVVEDATLPGVSAAPIGAGGALRYLGTATATGPRFDAVELAPGSALILTALATDAQGRTSGFAQNLVLGPGPRIDRITPAEGTSAGGTAVTLEGSGFGEPAGFVAFFGVREAVTVSVSDTTAVVLTPVQDAGPSSISIDVSDGRSVFIEEGFTFIAGRILVLEPGFNNVTWSVRRTLVTVAIAPLAGRVSSVYRWDAAAQRWQSFIVGAPSFVNTLSVLEPGDAIWVFISGAGPLTWAQPLP